MITPFLFIFYINSFKATEQKYGIHTDKFRVFLLFCVSVLKIHFVIGISLAKNINRCYIFNVTKSLQPLLFSNRLVDCNFCIFYWNSKSHKMMTSQTFSLVKMIHFVFDMFVND